jgi:phosphohistidine phosphatase
MQLLFLRHGVAEPRETWRGSDAERPLTAQGRKAMTRAAAAFAELGVTPDLIVTSPLVRARQTAEIAAAGLAIVDRLVRDTRLAPGFDVEDLRDILHEHGESDIVMLVGHEPDFSSVIARLIGGGRVVCKKGGLARVDVFEATAGGGELVWLLPPKDLTRRGAAA